MARAGRRRAALLLAVVALVVALAAGCAEQGGGSSPADDVVGEWELVGGTASGVALPRPPGSRATLEFDGEQAGGTSFCNHYSAGYRIDGDAIEFDAIGGTEMGCAPEVMEAEYAFTSALGAVRTVVFEGVDLLLRGTGVELRFRPVPPVPTSELVGTEWTLDTLIDGETASSVVAGSRLRLDPDGSMAATTACHSFVGTWTTQDDRVLLSDMAPQELDCPEDYRSQDAHEVAVLENGFSVSIEGDRLTALDADGRGLVYRAT
jgi:heat shock protein HslJ